MPNLLDPHGRIYTSSRDVALRGTSLIGSDSIVMSGSSIVQVIC